MASCDPHSASLLLFNGCRHAVWARGIIAKVMAVCLCAGLTAAGCLQTDILSPMEEQQSLIQRSNKQKAEIAEIYRQMENVFPEKAGEEEMPRDLEVLPEADQVLPNP